jgi:hypothetical protein
VIDVNGTTREFPMSAPIDDVNRIKNEIVDSFDEELELQMEEERIEDLVSEGMSEPTIFVTSSSSSTNWSACRTGSSTRS